MRACLFRAKSYNARVRVTQKDAGLKLVLFTGPSAPRAAKPCVRQSCHPAKSLSGPEVFGPRHVGSLQDTNLGLSKFQFLFANHISYQLHFRGQRGDIVNRALRA